MHGKNGVSWIVVSLMFILLLGNIMPVGNTDGLTSWINEAIEKPETRSLCLGNAPHAPIVIDGDANFSATASLEGWLGDGSSESPYIITGLDIDRGGAAGHCINISNTRANFAVQNCNLTGAIAGAGIFLNNVSFGFLFNNTCTYNNQGICLFQSNQNTVSNNTCFANGIGIYMYESDLNRVTGNDCDDNSNYGISLQLCYSNVIFNNLCCSTGTNGIHGRSVVSNTFANNTCNQNYDGIRIWDSSSGNTITNNTCNYNSNYGIKGYNSDIAKPLHIINNLCTNNDNGIEASGSMLIVSKNNLIDNDIYGIYTEGCDESIISYNSILRCYEGIVAYYSRYNTYSHNEISIGDDGIWFMESQDNMISENSISDFIRSGIILESNSDSNTIYLNDIAADIYSYEPEFYGVDLRSSDDNNMSMNYILHAPSYLPSSVAIRDSGSYNIIDRNWYNEYSDDDYNDDGFWDTPYSIPGSAGNSDPRPLVYPPHPPEWAEPPTDQVIDYWGQSFYYDLNASAPSPITWLVNDTIWFTIDSNGVLQTNTDLPVGSYGASVRVTNIYGLYIIGSFRLIIQEISLPEWIVGPVDFNLDYGEEFEAALIVTDESGISLWSINDTVNFTLTVTQLNVTGYNYGWHLLQINNATVLQPGMYQLDVSVTDPYGNALSGIFTITVIAETQDTTPPVWVITPIDPMLIEGVPLALQLAAWDSSGIDYGWVNDTIHFTIDENWIVRNATVLQPGVYGLEVRLYDSFDNYCCANLTVTILESSTTTATTTTHTTSPTTQLTTETLPSDGLFPIITFVLGVGLGGGIVVIVVMVSYKKAK